MPVDVAWAPQVVEKVARAICPLVLVGTDYDEVPVDEVFIRPRYQHLPPRLMAVTSTALSASPLPEALALIERLMVVDAAAFADTYDDAAAFLARVRKRKDRP